MIELGAVGSIPSPPLNGVHAGPFTLRAYGLMYVVGLLTAIAITARRWRRAGGDGELVKEAATWGFAAGIVGARLNHVATSWERVPHQWWGTFAVWRGGLAIWGGIVCGTLAGSFVVRRRGADLARFLDAAAPAMLVGQSIGRIGNYFNQELFGAPSTLPWALRIAPADRPPGYEQYATFHPTFLYEIVWNLLVAALLVRLGRRRHIHPPGLFALYVVGYSLGRVGEEQMRIDPAHHLLGMRFNFWLAGIVCLTGIGWFAWTQRRPRPRVTRAASSGAPAG